MNKTVGAVISALVIIFCIVIALFLYCPYSCWLCRRHL